MKRFEIETIVSFNSRVVVLAENLEEARRTVNNRVMNELNEKINLNIRNAEIKRISTEWTILPESLTENHHILLKLDYPLDQVISFTDEDAEAEIEALVSF